MLRFPPATESAVAQCAPAATPTFEDEDALAGDHVPLADGAVG